MYLVGRNFYGKLLPQVREVAGSEADLIIERHVGAQDSHGWLKESDAANPILGFGNAE